ncbi:MAG: hypothetical protein EOP84_01950 [Verrucomicrobiaceae bacterium]|nr:MAG: hypothetical protein EOP84_01950 [Verrucomicrobiaceae bacterium]
MKYPDGKVIHVGDLIWWNEGSCIGFIQSIAESKREYEAWGLDRPHLFLSMIHPFDPNEKSGIAHDETCLVDEAIGLLTEAEALDLSEATTKAGITESGYSVYPEYENGRMTHWRFEFPDSLREPIRIPADPLMSTP